MTPDEFRAIRKGLGLTQATLADWLGYGHRLRVTEIERGSMGISATLARLMVAYRDGYRPADIRQAISEALERGPDHDSTERGKAPHSTS